MAFIKEYEINTTGMIAPEAYFVVTNVKVEKRINNFLPPVDHATDTGYTGNIDPTDEAQMASLGPDIYWKKGYIGTITIDVWASKQARLEGKDPIGALGENPTSSPMTAPLDKAGTKNTVGTAGMDHIIKFFVDNDSSDNYVTQAYRHLRSTEFFSDAIED